MSAIEVLMYHIRVLYNCRCQNCEHLTHFNINIGCTKCSYTSFSCKYTEVLMNHNGELHNCRCQNCEYLKHFKNMGCTKCSYTCHICYVTRCKPQICILCNLNMSTRRETSFVHVYQYFIFSTNIINLALACLPGKLLSG